MSDGVIKPFAANCDAAPTLERVPGGVMSTCPKCGGQWFIPTT